jgi:hypothetical protein
MTTTQEPEVRSVPLSQVSWQARTRVGLELFWPREAKHSSLGGEYGLKLTPGLTVEASIRLQAPVEWRVKETKPGSLLLELWKPAGIRHDSADVDVQLNRVEGALAGRLPGPIAVAISPEDQPDQDIEAIRAFCAQVEAAREAALERRLGLEALRDWSRSSPEDPFMEVWTPVEGLRENSLSIPSPAKRKTTLPIHLPFLSRGQMRDAAALLRGAHIRLCSDGAMLAELDDAGFPRQPVSAPAIAAVSGVKSLRREPAAALHFQEERVLDATLAQWQLEPLAKLYNIEFDWRWLNGLNGELNVRLALDLEGKAAACWLRTPDQSTLDLFHQFTPASAAVQQCMRAWLPYLFFRNPEHLDTWEAATSVLVYHCLRPFTGHKRWEYTHDILDPATLRKALGRLNASLRRRLSGLHAYVKRRNPRLAKRYRPSATMDMIKVARRLPRVFTALLSGEKAIIDDLGEFAGACHDIGLKLRTQPAPSNLRRLGDELEKQLRIRLRHMCPAIPMEQLCDMIVIEATDALARSQGAPSRLEAVLELWHPGTGQRRIAVNRPQQSEAEEH